MKPTLAELATHSYVPKPLQGEWEQRVSSEKREIDAKEEVKAQRGTNSSSQRDRSREPQSKPLV